MALPAPAPEELEVGLSVCPGDDLVDGENTDVPIMVSVEPFAGTSRTPSDICCVVDISGSMGTEAMLKTETGDLSGHGLSVLDIVCHAMKTIIRNLTDVDRMALVVYSNEARTVFPLTEMSQAGRDRCEIALEDLQPAGMTNLWDGLKKGLELLEDAKSPGRLQHVMLFTDGCPNINPPRGILPMLNRIKDKAGGRLPCTVSTFGFGYDLDSQLLSEIAISGSGAYAFIPDAGFVGTVFVNAMSNLLVMMGKDAVLTLEATNGASFTGALGGHPMKKAANKMTISLGSLQFGQSKDVIVKMNIPAAAVDTGYLSAKLEYGTRAAEGSLQCEAVGAGKGDPDAFERADKSKCRLGFVDTVRACMQAVKLSAVDRAAKKSLPLDLAQEKIQEFGDVLASSPAAGSEEMAALSEDLMGQVSEALSREDWYTKWGIHYLPSLMFAHLTQQCNNFKDAGVQHYGGDLFNEVRDAADDIFCSLPAPTPRKPEVPEPAPEPVRPAMRQAQVPAPRPAPQPAPVVNMAAYYDRYAGCIDGASLVSLADGSRRPLADIRKGDVLLQPGGGAAKVECVVCTRAPDERFMLVELGRGLRVTPHHPVHVRGAWRFPKDVASSKITPCEAVYTVLLEAGGHAVISKGTPCVSLGHGIEDGAAAHPFFACRDRVVKDLSKFPSFATGFVELHEGCVKRDPVTGLVSGLTPPR